MSGSAVGCKQRFLDRKEEPKRGSTVTSRACSCFIRYFLQAKRSQPTGQELPEIEHTVVSM